MASDKQRIFRWLYRQAWSSKEQRFEDQLASACIFALGKQPDQADAYVQAHKKRLWGALKKEREIDLKCGRHSLFFITDEVGMKAVWNTWRKEGVVSAGSKRANLRWSARPNILSKIDVLGDRNYEALSCLVADLSGADRILLTPRGNEGGIDFFCKMPAPGKNHIFSGSHVPVRIIGQCKKYSSPVQVDKLRDFITSLNDVRHRAEHLRQLIPPWFSAAKGPIIGWMVAHSGFQEGAKGTAQNHGILLSDSIDVAEVIALSRQFHEALSGRERALKLNESLSKFVG